MPLAADCLSVRHYGASHGSHDHAHFQILLGLEGDLTLEVEGLGVQLGAGEGLVIAPGDRHDFESRRGARCLVLDSGNVAWRGALGHRALPSDTWSLAQYLARASELGRHRAQCFGPSLLREAWVPQHPIQRPRRAIDWHDLSAWAQALAAPPSVNELARRVHLSAAQFSARCQQELGQSPMHWVRTQRLTQARMWLDSGLSVAQTARRIGYRSASALTAALRRERI